MYILSVIPIQRGIPFSTLTYYSSEDINIGAIVQIPVGKQLIYGLVYEKKSLLEAKTHIKQASFSLKKIKRIVGTSRFATGITEGLLSASQKIAVPVGALAGAVINEIFFEYLQFTEKNIEDKKQTETSVVYGQQIDRLDTYKRIIRSSFASKQSIVFIVPSIRSLEFWYNTLSKGISTHSVILHSKCTKKQQRDALSTIKKSTRPLFICTTPSFSVIPREDISTLIIEEESSGLYKTHDRYEIDQRVVLESIAIASKMKIVYGDTLPRFETFYKYGDTSIARNFTPERLMIVPTDTYRTVLPSETVELIRYCQKYKKSIFIYTNRKGIAPVSKCSDCGTSVDCPTCGLPVVLRYKITEGEKKRIFICNHCGDTLPTTHVCTHCGGWNINPVSIGTESIKDFVENIVGAENIITVDDDINPDNKLAQPIIDSTQKQKWFVLIGTQKLLTFIKSIDFIVIPFFDRILSVASPYTIEESLRLIMECNEKTKDNLIVCTKKPDFIITKQLATKKLQEIINDDMSIREQLKYPPFGTLLKLSVTVPNSYKDSVAQKVDIFFNQYEKSLVSSRRISQENMKILCVWVIQVDNNYIEDNSESLQVFLNDLRFPNKLDINPNRL